MKISQKIQNRWNYLIEKYLHEKDSPDSPYGREWRYWFSTSVKPGFSLFLERQLIRWEGNPIEPRLTSMIGVTLYLNPREWKIERDHIYYDGPNCFWQFGPLSITRSAFGHCQACRDNC